MTSAQREPQSQPVFQKPGAPAAITSGDIHQTLPDYSPIHSRFARPVISPQLLRQLASLLCRSSSLRSHLLGKKYGKENVFRTSQRGSERAAEAARNCSKEPLWLTIAEVRFVAFLRKNAHTRTHAPGCKNSKSQVSPSAGLCSVLNQWTRLILMAEIGAQMKAGVPPACSQSRRCEQAGLPRPNGGHWRNVNNMTGSINLQLGRTRGAG